MSENDVSAKDAAKLIGIDYFALIRRIHRNQIRGVKRDGRNIYIPRDQVDRLARIKQLCDEVRA
jgi:predicted site-specific integrase-resolvase